MRIDSHEILRAREKEKKEQERYIERTIETF
jgi:hypothetical protein